jgi:NIMA (never in mitosis gene a)-related kinase
MLSLFCFRVVADGREFLPEKLMWSILTQLLLALHYCHTGGADPPIFEGSLSQNSNNNNNSSSNKQTNQIVLHRDIKPENSPPPTPFSHQCIS